MKNKNGGRAVGTNQYKINPKYRYPQVSIPLRQTSSEEIVIGACHIQPSFNKCLIHSNSDNQCVLHIDNCSYLMNQVNPEIPEILIDVYEGNVVALAQHPDSHVRELVAEHPNCDPNTLQLLLQDIDDNVRHVAEERTHSA
jgi:hypothetical protein